MIIFLLLAFSAAQDFSDHQEEGYIGEDLELSCEYPKGGHENKFFCKGEDPDTCQHLVNSSMPDLNSEKFRFEDSEDGLNVTILNMTAEDEGIYLFGCGNDTEHGNKSEIVCKKWVHPVRAVTGFGCEGGWVNFTCESPDNKSLPMTRTRIINNTVVVKNLQQEDVILCPTTNRKEIRIVDCRKKPQINRTVYNKAQATIKCGRPDSSSLHGPLYLRKETGDFDCKDVSLLTPHGLNATITDITPKYQGIYWCAEHKHFYDRSYRRVNITVLSNFSDHQERGRIGEDLELSCEYPKKHRAKKFFCKGEDPHTCRQINSSMPDLNLQKFRSEDSENGLNVTIFNITAEDGGTYWFGSGTDTEHGNDLEIFCRLELNRGLELILPLLVPKLAYPPPEAPSSFLSIVSLGVGVPVLVLLVLLVVFIVPNIKGKRRNEAPQENNRQEERVYEELQMADRCEYGTLLNQREDAVHTAPSGDALYDNVGTN